VAHTDVFALEKSGLNPFLFAEVGTELNGSTLTILSVLARLGQDPWAEAARWARLPKAAVVDGLTASILRMPLSTQALANAHATAARLILLLPSQSPMRVQFSGNAVISTRFPKWVPMAVLGCTLAFGLVAGYMTVKSHTRDSAPAPMGQTIQPTPPL
jgi:hypothetical protein